MGRGEESKEGEGEGEGEEGEVCRLSGKWRTRKRVKAGEKEIRREKKVEERRGEVGGRKKEQGRKMEGKHRGSENGAGQERGVGRRRYPSAILQITEQNEQPKEELLPMISHLLRCLDSAVYCWFPGKTAPKQSS